MAKRAPSSSSSGSQLIPSRRQTKRPTRERDWSNLTDGPAGLIAERVLAGDVADYVRFRAVCTAWRRCSTDPREHNSLDSRFHPRRWFMLREWPERAAPHRRRFINAATGQCVAVDLPEIDGHRSFGPTAEGLLVLLPSLATLLPRNRFQKCLFPRRKKAFKTCYDRDILVGRDLSVGGAGLAGSDGLIALYLYNTRMLAVAKPGDERWTLVLVDHRVPRLASSLSFAGRFYCVSDDADAVMTVETSENQPPRLVAAAELAIQYSPMMDTLHLVENGGELMLVHRKHRCMSASCIVGGDGNESHYEMWKWKYEVYIVDLDAMKTTLVHGLNGRALFVGLSRALSVCPKVFPSISADTIYPGFELDDKEETEAYHLTDATTEPSTLYNDPLTGVLVLARPYRINDVLSLFIRGYCDDGSSHATYARAVAKK
uniref:KIB1-4 beta-propeller domain-containing protein n=1 Tax=Oryza meridionalis TaxID=40149 RepID=A0A0E0D829_9ORYZ